MDSLLRFNPCFTGSTTSTINELKQKREELCFNPCFTGSTTSTPFSPAEGCRSKYVSILVLLEVPLQQISKSSRNAFGLLFQSLFYWKYHFNLTFIRRIAYDNCVSILVLLEVPLQRSLEKAEKILQEMFQSLFYWKYHFNTASFHKYRHCKGFQSLFYWKYHFNLIL